MRLQLKTMRWKILCHLLLLSSSFLFSGSIRAQAQRASPPFTFFDWREVTFNNLPAYRTPGSIRIPPEVADRFGYEPERRWFAGDRVADIATLGDFDEAFRLGSLTPENIARLSGNNLLDYRLSDLEFLNEQNIDSIVQAVGLEQFSPADIEPFRELLGRRLGSVDLSKTFAELSLDSRVSQILENTVLGELDLSQFSLSSIRGIEQTALRRFDQWQEANISSIWVLGDISFDQLSQANFPNSSAANAADNPVALIDVAYGSKETDRINTITGGYNVGFNYPCESPCAYLELTNIVPQLNASPVFSNHGRQWISGKDQKVDGGSGICKAVGGGREPTGRHPFGPAFKVVLEDVVESQGTGTFRFYTRIDCDFPGGGKTPYVFPIPIEIEFAEKDFLFIGTK